MADTTGGLLSDGAHSQITSDVFNCSDLMEIWQMDDGGISDLVEAADTTCAPSTLHHYFDFVYFSVVTASTVGFGDWAPPDTTTRMVLMIYLYRL